MKPTNSENISFLSLALIGLVIVLLSCKKKEEEVVCDRYYIYESDTADFPRSPVNVGDTVEILVYIEIYGLSKSQKLEVVSDGFNHNVVLTVHIDECQDDGDIYVAYASTNFVPQMAGIHYLHFNSFEPEKEIVARIIAN